MKESNELLYKAEKYTALWLTWESAGGLIAEELKRLIAKSIRVRADYYDVDYWGCESFAAPIIMT